MCLNHSAYHYNLELYVLGPLSKVVSGWDLNTGWPSLISLSYLIPFSGTNIFLALFKQWNADRRIYQIHTNLLVPLYVINHYIQDHLLKGYNLSYFLLFVDYGKAFYRLNRNILWNLMVRNFSRHLVGAVQSMCRETEIIIERWENYKSRCKTRVPIIVHLFQPYIGEVISWGQIELEDTFYINDSELNSLFLLMTRLSQLTHKISCRKPHIYCVKYNKENIHRWNKSLPIKVAAQSNAWTVFARSNTGVVVSNSTRDMNVCVCVYSVFVCCPVCR
jgi:hypothetical protein